MKPLFNREEAENMGFIVDDTVYPWFAYKGPRFNPTESEQVLTDRESELRRAIKKALPIVGAAAASAKGANTHALRTKIYEKLIKALAFGLICCCLTGCGTVTTRSPLRVFRARLTFYCPREDKYGSKIAIGGHAREGETMAAPSVIPFKSQVHVALLCGLVGNGNFVVQDRGTALEHYYRRGELRLDVYVRTRAKMRRLEYGLPEYTEVEIR